MRIRKPFAAGFGLLLVASGYLGLAPIIIPSVPGFDQSDKGLHFLTFFLLTLLFYWIFETARRRVIHITLVTCTGALAAGSEVLQGLLPNDRIFDPFDIVANVVGSLAALALCAWYHRRMLDRKRAGKVYSAVQGDEESGGDFELGQRMDGQEIGVADAAGRSSVNIDEELNNWDENAADDWDDEEANTGANDSKGKSADQAAS